MKIQDKINAMVTFCPDAGMGVVDVNMVVKHWDKYMMISQWHEEYTLRRHTRKECCSMKLRFPKCQAEKIIEKLKLMNMPSGIFRHGSIWKKY